MRCKAYLILFISAMTVYPAMLHSQSSSSRESHGFNLGYNFAFPVPNLEVSTPLPPGAQVYNYIGYRVGGLAMIWFNDFISLSPELNWSYNGGKVSFPDTAQYPEYLIAPTTFEVMVHARFCSHRDGLRPFFQVGPNVRFSVVNGPNLSIGWGTNTDMAINFGLGFEKHFRFFICAPELRYTYGLRDVNRSPQLDYVHHHTIALVVNMIALRRKLK